MTTADYDKATVALVDALEIILKPWLEGKAQPDLKALSKILPHGELKAYLAKHGLLNEKTPRKKGHRKR